MLSSTSHNKPGCYDTCEKIWKKNLVATIHVKKLWKWTWLLPYMWKKYEKNLVATIHVKKLWKWTWLLRFMWKNYENKPGCYDSCEKNYENKPGLLWYMWKKYEKNLVATIHVKKLWKQIWLLHVWYIWNYYENETGCYDTCEKIMFEPGCYDSCEKIMKINLVAKIHVKKWWKCH